MRNPPYRLSISGWFHGPLTNRLALPANIATYESGHPASELVNPTYLDEATHASISNNLINDSSIELRGFLKPAVWQKLTDEIKQTDFALAASDAVGPAHLRHFYSLRGTPTVDRVISFLRSEDFLQLLSAFTSLDFGRETKGRVQGRLFKKGCYTLLHDQGHDPDGVDVILSLGTKRLGQLDARPTAKINGKGKGKAQAGSGEDDEDLSETGWSTKWGGQIHYAPNKGGDESPAPAPEGEDEEEADDGVLTLSTRPNTLAIMVRNINTLKYVKYVNDSARDPEDGCPLARLDIEALYEVDVGGEDGESVEGELVEDEESNSEADDGDETGEVEEEWAGITRRSVEMEPDGPDELDDE